MWRVRDAWRWENAIISHEVCLSVTRGLLRKHGIDWIWETTATAEDERQKACTRVNKGNVLPRKPWIHEGLR